MPKGWKCLAKIFFFLSLYAWLPGCGDTDATFVVLPVGPTPVALGEQIQFTSTRPEAIWVVIGAPEKGTIDPFGLYTAPDVLPADPMVTILVQEDGEQAFAFVDLMP